MLARLAIIGGILFIGATSTYAQQAGIERKMLLQKEGLPAIRRSSTSWSLRQVHVR